MTVKLIRIQTEPVSEECKMEIRCLKLNVEKTEVMFGYRCKAEEKDILVKSFTCESS